MIDHARGNAALKKIIDGRVTWRARKRYYAMMQRRGTRYPYIAKASTSINPLKIDHDFSAVLVEGTRFFMFATVKAHASFLATVPGAETVADLAEYAPS